MEKIVTLMQILEKYIWNNCLNIDKSTYFTVIIGQISVYGILLTFYQFVASYSSSEKVPNYYLGIDITGFLVEEKTWILKNVVSKKYFCGMIILEILYKPFVTVYSKFVSMETIKLINCIWYFFVIIYFCLFVILFFQCAESILMLKSCSDTKLYDEVINKINNRILKKQIRFNAVDLLKQNLVDLKEGIQRDNIKNIHHNYNHLIEAFLNQYIDRKQNENFIIKKIGAILNMKMTWKEIENKEVCLLQEIMKEKYFLLDQENIGYIYEFHMNLLGLNFEEAKLAGYEKIKYDGNQERNYLMPQIKNENLYDVSAWKNLTLKIYRKILDKKEVISNFTSIFNSKEKNFYRYYCEECIKVLLEEKIQSIFKEESKPEDIEDIFGYVIKKDCMNDFYSQVISEEITAYNRFNAKQIISQLSHKNSTYLLTYIVMYYSFYKSYEECKYINLNVWKLLWKQHYSMKKDAEEVIKKMKDSNIGHYFSEKKYAKLIEYIEAEPDGKLFKIIHNDKILDMFIIWVLKICVIDEYDVMDMLYKNDYDIDTQVAIINELSKHEELLESKNILDWIEYVRYSMLKKQKSIPIKLTNSLRNFLLINIDAVIVANYAKEKKYPDIDVIGKYLLIKILELPNYIREQEFIKKIIKKAFIANYMNMDEYINMMKEECRICKCEINYEQSKKMKDYLKSLL